VKKILLLIFLLLPSVVFASWETRECVITRVPPLYPYTNSNVRARTYVWLDTYYNPPIIKFDNYYWGPHEKIWYLWGKAQASYYDETGRHSLELAWQYSRQAITDEALQAFLAIGDVNYENIGYWPISCSEICDMVDKDKDGLNLCDDPDDHSPTPINAANKDTGNPNCNQVDLK